MYALFRARRLLGSVPALIALVLIALGIQSQPLKIQPQYDESAVELALVEPEPEVVPEPVVEEPPPPPPVIEDEEAEPAPPPPPPKPVPKPLPKPEPKPKPVPKPVAAKPTPTPAPAPVIAKPVQAPPPRHRHPPRHRRRQKSMARHWKAVTSRVCATSWTRTSNTPPGARRPSNARVARWWSG